MHIFPVIRLKMILLLLFYIQRNMKLVEIIPKLVVFRKIKDRPKAAVEKYRFYIFELRMTQAVQIFPLTL